MQPGSEHEKDRMFILTCKIFASITRTHILPPDRHQSDFLIVQISDIWVAWYPAMPGLIKNHCYRI